MTDFPNVRGPLEIAVDLETLDPNLSTRGPGAARRDGCVIGIALGLPGEQGRYYPLMGPPDEITEHPLPEATIRYFKDLLLRPDLTIVGANLLYDLLWLRTLGIEAQGPLADVQLAEQLIEENRPTFNLESLSQRYLGRGKLGNELEQYAADHGWDSHWPHLHEMPISLVGRYAARDAWNTLEVHQKQKGQLIDQGLIPIYDLECELIRVVLDMSWRGIRVDVARCEEVLQYGRKERDHHIAAMQDLAGSFWDVDIWSVDALGDIARHLGLPIGVSEKEGDSFAKDFLAKHKDIPFYHHLAEARKFDRCAEVYVGEKILNMLHGDRLYPTWRQGRGDRYIKGGGNSFDVKGTRSGRFSSEAPNLQQLPARHGELASMVRSCLLPEAGEQWMSADYSSQEPRLTVHYGTLINDRAANVVAAAYQSDPKTDYHQKVRDMIEEVANVSIERKHAKTMNLGMCIAKGQLVLTNFGLVPIEAVSDWHRLWDGVEWVSHGGVVFNGIRETIEYEGLRATEDHIVFTDDERTVPFGVAASKGYPLRRYSETGAGVVNGHTATSCCKTKPRQEETYSYAFSLLRVWSRLRSSVGQYKAEPNQKMPKAPYWVCLWESSKGVGGVIRQAIRRNCSAVRSWNLERSTPIQRSWNQEPFFQSSRFCFVGFGNLAKWGVHGKDLRQNRQQWPLFKRQPTGGGLSNKQFEQGHGCLERINSKNPRKEKVYDILDVGPRNRFFCNGILVHNCYGMGKGKIMAELGVETDKAEAIFEAYHSAVPYVRKLQKMTTAKATSKGFIQTLLGRRRHFSVFFRKPYQAGDKPLFWDDAKREWPGAMLERAGAYKALNALIQGSAADQTKQAMVLCHRAGLKMLATVHDELCFSVSSEAEIKLAIEIMEHAVELAVPMVVDAEIGPSWGELEELK